MSTERQPVDRHLHFTKRALAAGQRLRQSVFKLAPPGSPEPEKTEEMVAVLSGLYMPPKSPLVLDVITPLQRAKIGEAIGLFEAAMMETPELMPGVTPDMIAVRQSSVRVKLAERQKRLDALIDAVWPQLVALDAFPADAKFPAEWGPEIPDLKQRMVNLSTRQPLGVIQPGERAGYFELLFAEEIFASCATEVRGAVSETSGSPVRLAFQNVAETYLENLRCRLGLPENADASD